MPSAHDDDPTGPPRATETTLTVGGRRTWAGGLAKREPLYADHVVTTLLPILHHPRRADVLRMLDSSEAVGRLDAAFQRHTTGAAA